MRCGLPWSEKFIKQLGSKKVRDEFVADQVRSRIALMIRALREQEERRWSQGELANKLRTTQSVVSRLENPDYGKLSLQTLLDVAAAFDLPLLVDIPEWDDWFRRTSKISRSDLERMSFNVESLLDRTQAINQAFSDGKLVDLDRDRKSVEPVSEKHNLMQSDGTWITQQSVNA